MNRQQLQELSELRLREARALFADGLPDGAYYLAGYADLDPWQSGISEVNGALLKANFGWNNRPTIFLRRMDEPFVHELREVFSGADDIYGMRLGGQKFGDQYIEDAFVYRIR